MGGVKLIGLASGAAKYIPPPAATAVQAASTGGHVDPLVIGGIGLGLVSGAMWRAASLREKRKTWTEVRDDFVNSLLAGLANAIAALFIVEWLDGGVLVALGVGMLVAATGVRAIQWAQRSADDYLRQRFSAPRKRHDDRDDIYP